MDKKENEDNTTKGKDTINKNNIENNIYNNKKEIDELSKDKINKKEKKNKKQQSIPNLDEEMKGFLIFTDKHREKNCIKDAYNILNDVAEKIYPSIFNNNINLNEEIKSNDKEDSKNISSKIDEEIKNLKKNNKIFTNFNTRCAAIVFIKIEKEYSDIISPKEIVSYIIKEVKETKKSLTKIISKLYPIEICTKYTIDLFKGKVDYLVKKHFPDDIENCKTWKIELRVRNNSSVNKKELMTYILGKMNKEKYIVEYKNPELTFLVEISCNIMCLSILENFSEYKSYNIQSLAKTEEELNNEKNKLKKLQNESKKDDSNNINNFEKNKIDPKDNEIELPKDDDEIDLI